jgi:phosphate/sulfate permease
MKHLSLFIFFILIADIAFGQEISKSTTQTITQSGIGLGSVIAVVTSWDRNKSILWALIHGILGWLYVIYYAFTRND